jgi:hypothetical protein
VALASVARIADTFSTEAMQAAHRGRSIQRDRRGAVLVT